MADAQKETVKSSNLLASIYNLWIFLPFIPYIYLVNKYAVNIPYQDDYDAVLDFLAKFKVGSFGEKIALLFSQHGEHRIFSSRLLYLFDYLLFGKVNFIHLIYVGNFQLLVAFIFFTLFLKKALPKNWKLTSLLVCICFFDLSSYENATFALSGTVNYGILMFLMGGLYFYNSTNRNYIIVAGLIQVVGLYSSGAGILCSIFLVLFNVINRRKFNIIVSSAVLVICAPLYFLHYAKSVAQGATNAKFSIEVVYKFFLHLTGGHFGFEQSLVAALVLLVLLVWASPLSLKFKLKENTAVFLCILGFLFGSIFTMAVFRSNSEMGEMAAYQSRYLIYSHLIVAVTFVLLVIKTAESKYYYGVLAVSILSFVVSYKANYEYGEACLNMTKNRLEHYPYYYSDHKEQANARAKGISDAACKLGIYCIQDER